jgi:pyruvate/2-oxoglutarate dehydrogenase complex dihydrolipoamide dehydrogenase (E3) component
MRGDVVRAMLAHKAEEEGTMVAEILGAENLILIII